jgi:glycosyltransferase involved in cell wall biosynthesis
MPSSYFPKIFYFRKVLKEIKPDLIISYCWGTSDWVIANSFKQIAPHIHNEEGFFDESPDKQLYRRWVIRSIFFRKVNCLLVPSLFLKNLAMKSWRIPENTIEYIPNGISIHNTNEKPNKAAYKCILVIVAAIHPIKNHLRLLKTFQKLVALHKIKLWVVGDGPDRDKIDKFIMNNNLTDHVELFGFRNHPEVFLNQAHIFCLTSDSEQMPMTVLEAMAAGLPVMATDVGDIKYMVSEDNKEFIVAPNNEGLFMLQLEKLIINSEICGRIGKKNREKCAAHFSIEKMLMAHDTLYRKTANFRQGI